MGLIFTGNSSTSSDFGVLLEALDGTTRVVVIASQEAIDDYGLDQVEQKAIEKYDAGALDTDGRLRVRTTDFA